MYLGFVFNRSQTDADTLQITDFGLCLKYKQIKVFSSLIPTTRYGKYFYILFVVHSISIVYSNMQKYGWEKNIEFVPKYCKKLNKSLGYVFFIIQKSIWETNYL